MGRTRANQGVQWQEYEALGHKIFTELMPHAEVKLDDSIRGRETESERQIDVSARWSDGDHSYLLIVQLRDRKKPADVNTVGEFRSVVQDVGANKGVLICSGGFSKKARTYARNIGISLYSVHDANTRAWPLELTVPLVWTNLIPKLRVYVTVYLDAGESLPEHPKRGYFTLSPDDGRRVVDLLGTI